MPESALVADLSSVVVAPGAQPKSSNPVVHLVRRTWAGFRNLIAELVAFPVRLRRASDQLIVMAELPGLQRNEVKVEVTDTILVIDAEPKRERGGPFRRAGRRIISLPEVIDIGLATAELNNGLLIVSLPTPHARKSQQVPVAGGDGFSSVGLPIMSD